MNSLFYTSLLSFMFNQMPENALIRYYHTADRSSYCAPVISNGTLYTQLDISGTQKQDVRYTYHGKNGSRQDMIPGVYLAGRRYNTVQRALIPFGYFEESVTIGGQVPERSENAGQILALGSASAGSAKWKFAGISSNYK